MKWITQTRNNETCRYSNNNTEKKRDEARKKTKSRDIYTNCQLKYVVVINMLSVYSRKTKIQNLNARTCLYTWMYVYIYIYVWKPRTDWKMFRSTSSRVCDFYDSCGKPRQMCGAFGRQFTMGVYYNCCEIKADSKSMRILFPSGILNPTE